MYARDSKVGAVLNEKHQPWRARRVYVCDSKNSTKFYRIDQPARARHMCVIYVLAQGTQALCVSVTERRAIPFGAGRPSSSRGHARERVHCERVVARFGALRSKIAWTKGLPENVDDGLGFMVRQRNVDIVQQILIE